MSDENKTPVTLESLMRLKRLERPPGEFWAQFDSELRAKQLAAIVDKRPWWSAHPRVHSYFTRHRVAVGGIFGGATALAAVVFSFTEFKTNTPAPWVARSGADVVSSADAVSTAVAAVPATAASMTTSASPAPLAIASVSPESTPRPVASADTFEPELASMVSAPSARKSSLLERSDRGFAFTARPMEANFAALQPAEPNIMRNMMALAQGFQSPLIATRTKRIEPLAQMIPPSEERRSRLLAETLPISTGFEATSASLSDHISSRRSDDRLYDSINQYSDMSSDRLSIRF
jgi:hypothetical protein